MSMVKKGSRKIIVDDIEYRWKIKKNNEPCPCCQNDAMNILIEKAETKKPLLIKIYDPVYSNLLVPIKPSDIKKVILFYLKKGWNPDDNKLYEIDYHNFRKFHSNINSISGK